MIETELDSPALTATAPPEHAPRAKRWMKLVAATPLPAALAISALAAIGLLLAGAAPRPEIVGMVLFVAFGSYGVDRFVDRAAERGHVRGQAMLVLSSLALFALAIGMAWRAKGPWLAAGALAFPLSVVAYCVPWLDGVGWLHRRGIRRVKDIPYTKNLYTTVCITASMVWAAVISGVPMSARLAAAAVIVALIEFTNAAACDLGDVDSDARNGVPTFAVRFGRARMGQVLAALAWAWAAAMVIGFVAGVFPSSALLGAASVIATHSYLRRLARGGDVGLFADVVPDLAVVLTAVAMLGARMV